MEANKPITIRFELLVNRIGMWLDGKEQYHREDEHPAVLFPDGIKEYSVNGRIYKMIRSDGTVLFLEIEE